MPKYLVAASYTSEGIKGVKAKGGTARREAVEKATRSFGGSVEAFYFAFGENDVYVLVDMPDNTAAAALSIAVSATGGVNTRMTPLLSPEEIDRAAAQKGDYRPPGA